MNPETIDLADSPYSNDEETEGFELSSGGSWYYPINYPIREYQYKIVESALFNNTLVCLPTGLGKTFIAAVVIYNFFRWYPRGKIVFMAPTRPLVAQQINACHDIMGIPSSQTIELTGSTNQKNRGDSWIQKRVIFATPQVFHNDLENGLVPRKDIKCVVIDEAHKALGNHAYCEAVRILSEDNKFFRILALSATPGNSIDKVREVVQKLKIANLELRDDTSKDILPYVNERKIDIALVCLSKELISFKDRYIRIMDPHVKNLMKRNVINAATANISKGRIFHLTKQFQENRQPNGGNNSIMKTLNILMTMTHANELMQRHGLRAFYNFYQNHSDKYWMEYENELKVLLEDIKNYLGDFPDVHAMPNGGFPKIPPNIVFGHTKFHKLKEILELHFRNAACENRDTRSIVFVEFKDSVREVFVLLLQCRPLIRPQMFVGQSDQKQKLQMKALEDFKNNTVNVLISTSVGEEGLDVGEVDLIVCFDGCQKNPSRLVQRMGRTGRKRTGQIHILVTDGKEYKDLKATLNKKDTFNGKVLQSSNIVSSMYQENPRMIPSQFNPTCRQIRFEAQPKTPQESKKRKKKVTVPAEKKRRTSNSNVKESSAQKSKAGPSSTQEEPTLSQGKQRLMNSFFKKPTASTSKPLTNTRTFDDRVIKNSEVKLLNDDNMGLDFLMCWTMLDSKPKPPPREFPLAAYVPMLPVEDEDDFLSSYHAPDLSVLSTIANWKVEDVPGLYNDSGSDEEAPPPTSIYDDDFNSSRSIIFQSPSSKYVRNDDDDSMFPSDDLFEAIDEKIMLDPEPPARPSVEPDLLKMDDGFDTAIGDTSIFSNLLDSSDEEETTCAPVTVTNLSKVTETGHNEDAEFESVGLFDDLLDDEDEVVEIEETKPAVVEMKPMKTEEYASSGLFDNLLDDESEPEPEVNNPNPTDGQLYKSCGLFDDLLDDSSEEEVLENSNMPAEKVQPVSQPEPTTKSQPISSQVSQALMDIRQMTLQDEEDSRVPLIRSNFPVYLNNNNPRASPKKQASNSERQSQSSQANSTRRFIESDSEEDMFIDDNFSDEGEKEAELNISLVNTPSSKVQNHFKPQNQQCQLPKCQDQNQQRYSRLSLFAKPKPPPPKPSKPSLSLKKNKPTIAEDDFDFSNIPVINVDELSSPPKKNKLSLSKLTSRKEVSTSKEPVRSTTSVLNFKETSGTNTQSSTSSFFAVKKPLKLSHNSAKYSSFFSKPSTSTRDRSPDPKSDIENEKGLSSEDEFVRPKTPKFKKSPLVPKNQNVAFGSPKRKKVALDDSYYGTPTRKDWLNRKRNERQRKKKNSPKKGGGFIEDEAEVTLDVDTSDGSSAEDEDEEMADFVSHTQFLDESHMQGVYLKSTRSPVKVDYLGNRKKYLPKAAVCSQPLTQGPDEYVNDSFCVDEDEELEDDELDDFVVSDEEYESEETELERMERLMKEKRKRKRNGSNERITKKRKKDRRASHVHSDSSSEDETEKLRRQIAEESMIIKRGH